MMTSIIEQITAQIREARLLCKLELLDNLVILKTDIAHGLSQKQPIKAQKTITALITSYRHTQALMHDSDTIDKYQNKIDLLESFLVVEDMLDTNALQQLLIDNSFQSIRDWMTFLKTNYADQYDGKLASTMYNSR